MNRGEKEVKVEEETRQRDKEKRTLARGLACVDCVPTRASRTSYRALMPPWIW